MLTAPAMGSPDRASVAEHVAGEDDVTKCRVSPRLPAGVLIEAAASVHKQYARPRPGKRLVPAQHAGQRGVLVAVRPVDASDIR
jgi:hypothetical protein